MIFVCFAVENNVPREGRWEEKKSGTGGPVPLGEWLE